MEISHNRTCSCGVPLDEVPSSSHQNNPSESSPSVRLGDVRLEKPWWKKEGLRSSDFNM
jgi:hypothetical protein